jgi:hypothetical protein
LKEKIREIKPKFSVLKKNIANIDYARGIIKETWSLVDMDLVRTFIRNMPARVAVVIAAKGWYTHY